VQTFFIVEAFDPNLQLKLIPRTVQRALINLAIEDAIAGKSRRLDSPAEAAAESASPLQPSLPLNEFHG